MHDIDGAVSPEAGLSSQKRATSEHLMAPEENGLRNIANGNDQMQWGRTMQMSEPPVPLPPITEHHPPAPNPVPQPDQHIGHWKAFSEEAARLSQLAHQRRDHANQQRAATCPGAPETVPHCPDNPHIKPSA